MDLVGLIVLILTLAVIGFLVHVVTTQIPMPDLFKQTIVLVVVIAIVLYVLGILIGQVPAWPLSRHG